MSFILFIYWNISMWGEEDRHDYSLYSTLQAPQGNTAVALASLRRLTRR